MNTPENQPESLILSVAGVDRSADLGREVADAAKALPDGGFSERMAGEVAIIELGAATSESDFLDRTLKLFASRTQFDIEDFDFPASTGALGGIIRRIRGVLWRLTRHPHDWALFHQNAVNEQMLRTLELEVRLRKREAAELRERVTALESQISETGPLAP